jgi:hypothetical protein
MYSRYSTSTDASRDRKTWPEAMIYAKLTVSVVGLMIYLFLPHPRLSCTGYVIEQDLSVIRRSILEAMVHTNCKKRIVTLQRKRKRKANATIDMSYCEMLYVLQCRYFSLKVRADVREN